MSLILEADEMSGTHLGGFEFAPSGTRPELEQHCSDHAVRSADVRTNKGVRLGLSRTEAERLLKLKGRDSADVLIFERTVEKSYRDRTGSRVSYDESSTLSITFRNGIVVSFSGWRVNAS